MLWRRGLYHWVFLKGAREGWPVIGSLVKLVVQGRIRAARPLHAREPRRDGAQARRDAGQAGQLEALGERVSGLAGVNTAELKAPAGQGGALVDGHPLSMEELQATLADLEQSTGQHVDLMTVLESRLFDQKISRR